MRVLGRHQPVSVLQTFHAFICACEAVVPMDDMHWHQAEAGLLATPPCCVQNQRPVISGTWLCTRHSHCTCGSVDHEPWCGLTPEVDLSTIEGWSERPEMRTEWGRAYRMADGRLFVDDDDGAFQSREDVARFVRPGNPESPYDLIVQREVSEWQEMEA